MEAETWWLPPTVTVSSLTDEGYRQAHGGEMQPVYTQGSMNPVRVLVVAKTDLTPELGDTVLWRTGIERVFAPAPGAAREAIARLAPRLVVVDAIDAASTCRFIEALRAEPATRALSVAVLSRDPALADEEALLGAGANAVFSGHLDPALWDGRLEQLLEVPPRREVRVRVLIEVWSQFGSGGEPPIEGWALNMSIRGALIETDQPFDLGSKLDLTFMLPGTGDEVRAVAQMVREAGEHEGRYGNGVEFLILRGDARARIEAFLASERGA
jgi:CheY-like chemotaxis protein